MVINNEELIEKAKSVIKPRKMPHGFTAGDCGCALVTDKGNIYCGVSIDTAAGLIHAEQNAIGNMVTNGEYKINKLVAIAEDGTILPPCGRCREFIYQIHKDNLDTDVILKKNKTIKLKDLLPLRWDE